MATKPNLPGCDEAPATSTPRGANRAANCSADGAGRDGAPLVVAGGADLDECVDRDGHPVGADDQRVDVDAQHVRPLGRDPPESDEHRGEGVAVDGGLAAELAEQALRGQLVDHLVRRDVVDGRRPEHDVGHRLGEDPAEAEHHGRPELRVAQHAGDQLAVAPDHRRDEHVDRAVGGRRRRQQLGRRAAHRIGVGEVEPDEAALGLVGDGVAVELGDDREAELGGRGDGRVGVGDPPLSRPVGRRNRPAGPSTRTRTACWTTSPRRVPRRPCRGRDPLSPADPARSPGGCTVPARRSVSVSRARRGPSARRRRDWCARRGARSSTCAGRWPSARRR